MRGLGTREMAQVARQAVGSKPRLTTFLGLGLAVTALYSLLLPFDYTQRLGLDNLRFLTPLTGIWSVLLGFGFAFLLTVQIHATRAMAAGRSAPVGGFAAVVSLLPSFLCCTPLVPTALAFIGLSGASLYSTTGGVQHFFATEQTPLLLASLALILAACGWSLHRIAGATCLCESACQPDQNGAELEVLAGRIPQGQLSGTESLRGTK